MTGAPGGRHVPEGVVARLSLYLRHLENLRADNQLTISSNQLGAAVGCTAAQIRKDLGHFGQFGRPGVGYPVSHLAESLKRILGTNRLWEVALVGVGNLGAALIAYGGIERRGFTITCAFDIDPTKIGRRIEDVTIQDPKEFARTVRRRGIRVGIITVGAAQAQTVADLMVSAGVCGILNFAPTQISVPPDVHTSAVDLAVRLEQLTFHMGRPAPAG